MDRMIYDSSEKDGSIDVETRVYLTEDNENFEVYQYLFNEDKKFSGSEVICNCVRISSFEMVKIIRLAAELLIYNASKNES